MVALATRYGPSLTTNRHNPFASNTMNVYQIQLKKISQQINDPSRFLLFFVLVSISISVAVFFFSANERWYIIIGGVAGVITNMMKTAPSIMRVDEKTDEQRILKCLNSHWNIAQLGQNLTFSPKRRRLFGMSSDNILLTRSNDELYLSGPYYTLKKIRKILSGS